jgi:hypothetical protein
MVFSVRGKVGMIGGCGQWKAGRGVFRSPRILPETANPLQSVMVRITAPGLNEALMKSSTWPMTGQGHPRGKGSRAGVDRHQGRNRHFVGFIVVGIAFEIGKVVPGFGQFIAA